MIISCKQINHVIYFNFLDDEEFSSWSLSKTESNMDYIDLGEFGSWKCGYEDELNKPEARKLWDKLIDLNFQPTS